MGLTLRKWMQLRRVAAHEVGEADRSSVSMSPELAGFVRAVSTASDFDDPEYVAAVERLQADGGARVREIETVFDEIGTGGHALRQCLLMAAATIPQPESVDFLRRTALSEQRATPPTTTSKSGHRCLESRAVTAEEALRVQAVEGIEALARVGVSSAVDRLVECVDHGSLAVRAIGLTALGEIDGAGDVRADVIARLGPDQRHLADLRRVDVRDVAQVIDPQAHLARRERTEPPPPDIEGRQPWPASGRATPRATRSSDDG